MTSNIAFGILIGMLFISLIALFCIVLIKVYIQKIKKYNALIYQNEIDFQKTLNQTILETQEQLLNAVSQDLHDDAGQQLTVINFQIENLKIDHPELEQQLGAVSNSAGRLSHSLRQISHSLNNNWLIENGLLDAIQSEADRIAKNGLIAINLHLNDNGRIFTTNEKIVIYRIFQEAVNNALKHSKANILELMIVTEPLFKATVTDNGVGFNLHEQHTNRSIGLQNCISRAQMIGYEFSIISKPNQGTTVVLEEKQSPQI